MSLIPVSSASPRPLAGAPRLRDYEWLPAIPLILMHLVPLLAFYTGTRWQDWAVCAGLYVVRMFGVTGGYHRYFSHRTYKTSRLFQFLLALLAMSSSQKGVLWWASHHRDHHRLSDQDGDPHDSRRGFWYSHIGWIYHGNDATDLTRIKDLARYPELVFLNKYWQLPPALLGVAVYLTLGWSGLLIGFCLSTALLWHGTFTINSLSHMLGSQRYESGDASTNNWVLAIITLGEGWHNNHHHFMGSTRQGFYWWEIDISYYVLRVLGFFGLVWDIKEPPARVFDPATHKQPSSSPAKTAQVAAAAAEVAPPAANPSLG